MTTLNITKHIATELKTIIDNAIEQEQINAKEIRMIIIHPNSSFDALEIYHSKEWENFFSLTTNDSPIGSIDISMWLDLADEGLGKNLDKYSAPASKYIQKYSDVKQKLTFDHISDPAYKSYLICLRQALFSQTIKAARTLATQYFADKFKHVVGIVLNNMMHDYEEYNYVAAFTHANGAGPFHNVKLSLPDIKLTYPYLKFNENGCTLFYPKGNKLDDSLKKESNVYTIDMEHVKYIYSTPKDNPDEIVFRMDDEFEDWELSAGHTKEDRGDLSYELLFSEFKKIIERFPEKILDKDFVPNPLEKKSEVENWIKVFIENNQKLSSKQKRHLFTYGTEAVEVLLKQFPPDHNEYSKLKLGLASTYFEKGDFKKVITILSEIKNLSKYDMHYILESCYFLNDKKEFDLYYNTIEDDSGRKEVELSSWLYDIKTHVGNPDKLEVIEKDCLNLFEERKNRTSKYNPAFALTKLYLQKGNEDKAIHFFREIDLDYGNLLTLVNFEFKGSTCIKNEVTRWYKKKEEKKQFIAELKAKEFRSPDSEIRTTQLNEFDEHYIKTNEISIDEIYWIQPLSESVFIIYADQEIFIAKLTKAYEWNKLDSYTFGTTAEIKDVFVENNTLYVPIEEEGILCFDISDHKFELTQTIKNQNSNPGYSCAAVDQGMLYAVNQQHLEIYDLKQTPAKLLLSEYYVGSQGGATAKDGLLFLDWGSLLILDVSEPSQPKIASEIVSFKTGENHYFKIIDQHLVGGDVIDIKDPKNPVFVHVNQDDSSSKDAIAPVYDFTGKIPDNVIVGDGNVLLKQLVNVDGKLVSAKWMDCLSETKEYPEMVYSNICNVFIDNTLMSFSQDEIYIFEKQKKIVEKKETYSIQDELAEMMLNTVAHYCEKKAEMNIGKLIVGWNPHFYAVQFEIHPCSSFAVNENPYGVDTVTTTSFSVSGFLSETQNITYDPKVHDITYDLQAIINSIVEKENFKKKAAKTVMISIDNSTSFLSFPNNPWNPVRSIIKDKQKKKESKKNQETDTNVAEILSVYNIDLFRKLAGKIAEPATLEQFIEIFNDDITQGKDVEKRKQIKDYALWIFSAKADKGLVKKVLLNGVKYGKPIPEDLEGSVVINDPEYLSIFADNDYEIFEDFENDKEVRSVLETALLNDIEDKLATKIAIRLKKYDHPSIHAYIDYLLTTELNFNHYMYLGGTNSNGINLSALPPSCFLPFKEKLIKAYTTYNESDEVEYQLRESIISIVTILAKLGQDEFSEKICNEAERYKYTYEQNGDFKKEDKKDSHLLREEFLATLLRRLTVQKILKNLDDEKGTVWPENEKPELYKNSWYHFFAILFQEDKNLFVNKLTSRLRETVIQPKKSYDADRKMAIYLIHYSMFQLMEDHPEIASAILPLIDVIEKHADLFDDKDISFLKRNGKQAILQEAWNALQNKDFEAAKTKGDLVLSIDPNYGQAHYFKARLLWLTEGIDIYLEQRKDFEEKAVHDKVAIASLYNLSGCALDEKNKLEESLAYFKKAALANPSDAMYYANIGEVYYKMKQPEEALNYVQKAKEKGNSATILDEIIKNKGVIPVN
ncbi:tetratricopeptide repeat protein [Aquimarina megaterium]|uniref:hypothetical protein n=1 Tax=Aquimarina megaterium TaxID=1443666 RepID=UPI00046EA29F|nr:hypothetical protein [Aquimarina megaterium]